MPISDAAYKRKLRDYLRETGQKPAKPLITLDQEIAQIRERYRKRCEYNRQRKAIRAAANRGYNAITPDVVDQPHD